MEDVSAPWCVGSVFPAPQLLTGAAALPLGPVILNRSGHPRCLLNTGCPLTYSFCERFETPVLQAKEFLENYKEDFFPQGTLVEHLQEDASLNSSVARCSNYLVGNRLEGIESKDGGLQLFFPVGKNIDRIGSCVLLSNSNDLVLSKGSLCDQSPALEPYSISPSLCQPILQIAAAKESSRANIGMMESSIAVRTAYQLHWLTSQVEDACISFGSKGVATFEHCTSHVTWSPHLPGEAAVILENGDVQIFDLNSEQFYRVSSFLGSGCCKGETTSNYTDHFKSKHTKRKANLEYASYEETWWSCEYAWHPQTLLVAGCKDICLVDLRHKLGSRQSQIPFCKSTLASIGSAGGLASFCNQIQRKDRFTALTRADYDGMYQFAAASTHHLLLFDIRQPHIPLLQWHHGMEHEPPGLLRMCFISDLCPQAESTLNNSSAQGRIIMACSCKSGDLHAFCYGPQPLACFRIKAENKKNYSYSCLNDTWYSWGIPFKLSMDGNSIDKFDLVGCNTVKSDVSKLDKDKLYIPKIFSHSLHLKESPDCLAFESSAKVSKARHFGLAPRSKEWENISGMFNFSFPNVDTSGFTMLELTGPGLIISTKYKASMMLDTTTHELQAVPQPLAFNASNCGSDLTGKRPKKKTRLTGIRPTRCYCQLELMPAFLSYIQCGSIWPAYIESEILLNTQRFPDTPVPSQQDLKIAADKIKDMCLQLIKEAKNPLSIYEISLKVLWRTLPYDLVQRAVERRKAVMETNMKRWKSWTGLDLPEISPASDLCSLLLDAMDLLCISKGKEDVMNELDTVKSTLIGPAVPLPVLLEIQQFSIQNTALAKSKGECDYQSQDMFLSESQEKHVGSYNYVKGTKCDLSGHNILSGRCSWIAQFFENFTSQNLSPQKVESVVSLNDSVDSWSDNLQRQNNGSSQCFLFHGNGWTFLPTYTAVMPTSRDSMQGKEADVLQRDDAERHFTGSGLLSHCTGTSKREDNSFDNVEFQNFIGSSNYKAEDGMDEASLFKLDIDLCPIALVFKEYVVDADNSSESEELVMLTKLKDQFQKWQEYFQPYISYCNSRLYKQASL